MSSASGPRRRRVRIDHSTPSLESNDFVARIATRCSTQAHQPIPQTLGCSSLIRLCSRHGENRQTGAERCVSSCVCLTTHTGPVIHELIISTSTLLHLSKVLMPGFAYHYRRITFVSAHKLGSSCCCGRDLPFRMIETRPKGPSAVAGPG